MGKNIENARKEDIIRSISEFINNNQDDAIVDLFASLEIDFRVFFELVKVFRSNNAPLEKAWGIDDQEVG